MHIKAAERLIESVRRRGRQGDCPTEPALGVELLEDLVLALADRTAVNEPPKLPSREWMLAGLATDPDAVECEVRPATSRSAPMDSETSRDDYDVVEEIRSSVKTAGHFDTLTDDGARRVVDALGRVLDVLARNDPSIRAALDAAPHAAPREGEPEPDAPFRDHDYPSAARSIALNLAEFCDESLPYPAMIADAARRAASRLASQQAALDAAGEDVAAMLRALGLGDHARPASAHAVVQDEILPALAELVRSFLALAAPADAESPAGIIRDRLAARASHPEARDGLGRVETLADLMALARANHLRFRP